MLQETSIEFINDLHIEAGEAYSKMRILKSGTEEILPVQAGEEQSFFSEKSLVSFASSVSAANRNDVLQSTLLAQMAANLKVKNKAKVFDWYKVFMDTLEKTGWIVESAVPQTYNATESEFEVDNVVIDIISSAFGKMYIDIIKKTLSAIKNMGDDDRKIKAFERNTKSVDNAGFQIALANEDGGIVSMQIGTFMLTTSHDLRKVFFFKTEKEKTNLQYMSRRATFNSTAYSVIRDAVNQKIADALLTNISEIKI